MKRGILLLGHLGVATALFSLGLFGGALGTAAAAEKKQLAPRVEVTAPKDGERIPRKDQDPCPERGPCQKIYVTGHVETGYWPFLAVAPLNAAPRIWIQPPVVTVKKDGSFMGMVYLGTERIGAGEKFSILVFAHKDKMRFREADVLMSVPDDVVASDPVTVLRTR
jgi:hypothetical protein